MAEERKYNRDGYQPKKDDESHDYSEGYERKGYQPIKDSSGKPPKGGSGESDD